MKAFFVAGFTLLCIAPALAASDDFNRTKLGKKWDVVDGTMAIQDNQLTGSDNAAGLYKKSVSDTDATVTVSVSSAGTQYGAVVIGDLATNRNAYVKIQSVSSTTFTNGAFYEGDNGQGSFFALTQPVPSPAKLEVTLCGSVATMKITSAVKTQKYTYDYGADAELFGTGTGLGIYGAAALDDYKSKIGKCKADPEAIRITRSTAVDPTKVN